MTDQNDSLQFEENIDIPKFDLNEDIKKSQWQRTSLGTNLMGLEEFSKCQSMINFKQGSTITQTNDLFSSTPTESSKSYYINDAQAKVNSIPSQLYTSRKFISFPTKASQEFYELRTITPQTFSTISINCRLIDCCSMEEFNEGNILHSLNATSPSQLVDLLFGKKATVIEALENSTILVFYCRNSKGISPFLIRFIRAIDRLIHHDNYPRLAYPHMYLLEGGMEAGIINLQYNGRMLGLDEFESKYSQAKLKVCTRCDIKKYSISKKLLI